MVKPRFDSGAGTGDKKNMYHIIEDKTVLRKSELVAAGLSEAQVWHDSSRGRISVLQHGLYGETLFDVRGYTKRPARKALIEAAYGPIPEIKQSETNIYNVEIDQDAHAFFLQYRTPEGMELSTGRIIEYTNRASIFLAIKNGLKQQQIAYARQCKRMKMGIYWKAAAEWFVKQSAKLPCDVISNARSLERAFNRYCNEGYIMFIHSNYGNDAARKVSADMEALFMSLWCGDRQGVDMPFVDKVYRDYRDFLAGKKDLFDKKTGEILDRSKYKPVSRATVWNYLKRIDNMMITYEKREGHFKYVNGMMPALARKRGMYSLSKITMDDVMFSRKSEKGWVTAYVAWDVVSEYRFRPAYVTGDKPTMETVKETVRNMMSELISRGIDRMPYEADVEHHLVKHIEWMNGGVLFAVTTYNDTARGKIAEAFNRRYKYVTQREEGHSRNRHFGKGAYAGIKIKKDGDFVEPTWPAKTLIDDDLSDTEKYNTSLHSNQKRYPGMTRRDVLLKYVNERCRRIAPYADFRHYGHGDRTTIRQGKKVQVNHCEYWLTDDSCLRRLKPNSTQVEGYWMDDERVYLYQEGRYIGEAENIESKRYSDCKAEWTEEDRSNYEWQLRQRSKVVGKVNARKRALPALGVMKAEASRAIATAEVEIVPATLPATEDCEICKIEDFSQLGIDRL